MFEPWTLEREIGVSIRTSKVLCPWYTFTPRKVLVIPRRRWLSPDMTKQLFTGTLSLHKTKTNRTVQPLKMPRDLKFLILEEEWYQEADLRLCFRIYKSQLSHYAAHCTCACSYIYMCACALSVCINIIDNSIGEQSNSSLRLYFDP